jgi:hypothetical protein
MKKRRWRECEVSGVDGVLTRFQVKAGSAEPMLHQILEATGLSSQSLASQMLFVVFFLDPILVHKYGKYRVVYEGDRGEEVRMLASTYTQGHLSLRHSIESTGWGFWKVGQSSCSAPIAIGCRWSNVSSSC